MLIILFLGCTPEKEDTSITTDTYTTTTTTDTDTQTTQLCEGNEDGIIDFDEFVADPSLGIAVSYTVNEPGSLVDVDLNSWDFSQDEENDETWIIQIKDLVGTWFESYFPTATYYVPLDASNEVVGIYKIDNTEQQLQLLGLASVENGVTVLVYDKPVTVFDFPIQQGRSWASKVSAIGMFEGEEFPADYGVYGTVNLEHNYIMEVDSHNTTTVPMGEFDTLRVKVLQEMSAENSYYGTVESNSSISYFYASECIGLVARIRSKPDEKNEHFSQATEYLRLGL